MSHIWFSPSRVVGKCTHAHTYLHTHKLIKGAWRFNDTEGGSDSTSSREENIKHLSLSSYSEFRHCAKNIAKSKTKNVSFPCIPELLWLRRLTHQMNSLEPKHHKHQSFGGCHLTTLLVTWKDCDWKNMWNTG